MWVKLDDALFDHRKIFAAGDVLGKNGPAIALGFYAAGLLYANKHFTDGFLPIAVVKHFRHADKPLKVAAAMVEVALWDEAEGGFRIHDYHDHNPKLEDVKAKKEWDVTRKRMYSDAELVATVRRRDQDLCRYCARHVNWHDRRGPLGGQYDHVVPRGPNTVENIVVACRGCNNSKGGRTPEQAGMKLLPPPNLELVPNQNGTGSELEKS